MKARARFVKPAWTISVRRQCELLTVNRGQLYYAPKEERPENLEMMRLMDKHLIDHPTEGVLSMVAFLRDYNFHVNPKRIRRLFGLMGYQAIYPRKNLSKLGMAEFIKPYLLRGLKITRPNQVWCTDITYIPMRRGFLYLTAIMDVYSRYLNPAETGTELYQQVEHYITYYNNRFHQGIKTKPNVLYDQQARTLALAS